MLDVIGGNKTSVPAVVLEAVHTAVVERYGETSIHHIIFAHAGLLGDYLLFIRHSYLYLAVSAVLRPEKQSLSGLAVKNVWKADILTAYDPPAADWGDEVD